MLLLALLALSAVFWLAVYLAREAWRQPRPLEIKRGAEGGLRRGGVSSHRARPISNTDKATRSLYSR
jgi:hypothetical protein